MGLDDAVPALVQVSRRTSGSLFDANFYSESYYVCLFQVLNRFVTPREVDAAYYDSMGVALEQDEEYRADVRVDFELFKKLYQS